MNPQDARIWVERTQESGQDAGGAERGGLAMGRLVQVSIAIWLLPALLMVLVGAHSGSWFSTRDDASPMS